MMLIKRVYFALSLFAVTASILAQSSEKKSQQDSKYRDGRPEATLRMDAKDHGIVLRY